MAKAARIPAFAAAPAPAGISCATARRVSTRWPPGCCDAYFFESLAAGASRPAGLPRGLPLLPAATAPVITAAPTPLQVFNVRAYGAVGDGRTDDAPAIQRALNACTAAGGGRVLLPAGATFVAGPLALRSHVELCLESGATLRAHPEPSRYRRSAFAADNLGEGSRWISADSLEQVTLCGGGVIDGNAPAFLGPATGGALRRAAQGRQL
ncbi:MAG: glycosyl hydrolase family 28-related protein [Hymenobacter sp.]